MEMNAIMIGGDTLFREIVKQRFSKLTDPRASKAVPLSEAIAKYVRDGMSIHVLGLHCRSHAAIRELYRQFWSRNPGFTIVAGALHGPIMALFHAGMVKKAITAFVGEAYPTMGPNPVYNRIFKRNGVTFENWSFLTLTQRLLAGAMGIGFFPTRSLLGSDVVRANERECRPIEDPFGVEPELLAVRALRPDISIVHGHAADEFGNTIILPPRGEDVYGVLGSLDGAIVTVEKIVSPGFIRRHSHLVRLPGIFVKSVSEVPMGAHPSGLSSYGLPEIDGYCEDIPFYLETREAAKDQQMFDSWIREWILSCKDHHEYLAKLGSRRVHHLKGRSRQDAWICDLEEKIPGLEARHLTPSPLERAVLAGATILRRKVANGGYKSILVGAGLASLASWVAIYGLQEEGAEVELMSELGFYGFAPRPGEPFLFNQSNIPTCKMLDGIMTVLGLMVCNPNAACVGALSGAQVDRFGNLNSTLIPETKTLITGSGGANDVMSTAQEVVIIMPQSRERFVARLPFVTSPGRRARTLVSTLGIFEKLGNEEEFTLTAYFADQLPAGRDAAIREIREQCGWDLKVIQDPALFSPPCPEDLATLRLLDLDRYFLRASR